MGGSQVVYGIRNKITLLRKMGVRLCRVDTLKNRQKGDYGLRGVTYIIILYKFCIRCKIELW